MIHNVEETDDYEQDNAQVTKILNEVTNDKHLIHQQQLSIYRLGKRSPDRNRTVKVHFNSEDLCRNILQHTRKLGESVNFKHVVIQPDLTPIQRHHLKMLVKEKKQRNYQAVQCKEDPDWTIRSGKLCRRRDTHLS